MAHRQLRRFVAAVVAAGAGLSTIAPGAAFAQDTVSLTIAPGGSLGSFVPGVARDYTASLAATATATGADTTLTVRDPSPVTPGHLVNAGYSLTQALQARAASATGAGSPAFAPIANTPLGIWSWTGAITSEPVTISFRQSIGATDGLLGGDYGKVLELTLSSVTP